MAELTPAWTQDGSYAADRDRGVLSALLNARHFVDLAPQVTKVDAGGGHGVVGSGDLVVSAGAGHSVDVAAGQAIVRGTQQSGQGPYIVSNDAAKNVAIATPDATNGRIDLIQARVIDAAYSGTTGFSLVAKTGTPAATPAVPTPDENTLVLAEVLVPAGAASAASYTITDRRTRAAALGGTQVCSSSTQYPNPASEGMRVYDRALDRELVHDGSSWVAVSVLGAWTAFTPVWRLGGNAITLGNATNVGRLRQLGKTVEFYAKLVVGSTTGFPANDTFLLDLPVNAFDGDVSVRPIGTASGVDASPSAGSRAFAEIAVAANRVGFFPPAGPYFSGTSPWTWAAGDTLFVVGSYEAA